MNQPYEDPDLLELIARYERAYTGRMSVLPDNALVQQANGHELLLHRGAVVKFQRHAESQNVGCLRFALLLDGVPFVVVTVQRERWTVDYRVAMKEMLP